MCSWHKVLRSSLRKYTAHADMSAAPLDVKSVYSSHRVQCLKGCMAGDLRKSGASIAMVDQRGMSPLHHACRVGNMITAGSVAIEHLQKSVPGTIRIEISVFDEGFCQRSRGEGRSPLQCAAQSCTPRLQRCDDLDRWMNALRFLADD